MSLRAKSFAACAVIVAAVLATYARAIHQDFVDWDDQIHVFRNPHLARLTAANLGYFWTHPYEELYIPLSYMAFALITLIARMPSQNASITSVGVPLDPHIFHAANVIVHAVNALLVFAILRRFTFASRDSAILPALSGALLFALHPLQVESVAWISELRGLLCTLFSLTSVWLYLSAAAQSKDGTPFRCVSYWVALLGVLLALLCKPVAAALPLGLLALDAVLLRRPLRVILAGLAPWALVVVPFIIATHHAQPVPMRDVAPLLGRPFVAADAVAFYLVKLLAPVNLTIDYGRKPYIVLHHAWGYAGWLLPAVAAGVAFRLRRSRPWLLAGALFSVAMLLPVLGLVPFAYQAHSTVADRYMYLAMLGPSLIVAGTLGAMKQRGFATYGIIGAVLCACAVLSVGQIRHWDNSLTLFPYAISLNRTSPGIRDDFAGALLRQGRVAEAVEQYRTADRLHPRFARFEADLGAALLSQGNTPEATVVLRSAVSHDPGLAQAHRGLGIALMRSGKLPEAIPELANCVRLDPAVAESHAVYGDALMFSGLTDDALAEYSQALEINPSLVPALNGLAGANVRLGRLADAEALCRRAVAVAPSDARSRALLAAVLNQVGKSTEAVAEYRRAIAISPDDPVLHYNLGSVLLNTGDAVAAVGEFQSAVRLNSSPANHRALAIAYQAFGDPVAARREMAVSNGVPPTHSN